MQQTLQFIPVLKHTMRCAMRVPQFIVVEVLQENIKLTLFNI